jgi:hypothetical protein
MQNVEEDAILGDLAKLVAGSEMLCSLNGAPEQLLR